MARRALLASGLALGACGHGTGPASARSDVSPGSQRGRRPVTARPQAPFAIGTEIITDQLADPVFEHLASTQFSQISTGYELKMEYLLRPDGSLRFDGADRIAAFCRANGQGLHCHTLIWYAENPAAFRPVDGDPAAFGKAFDHYIQSVAGRYAGRAKGWDVVNEPIADDGTSLRESLWSRNLGQDGHFIRAFEQAKQADPNAVLLVNEYDLENKPVKRASFLKLVEAMLKRGVPIGGIGNQSHIAVGLAPGEITEAMRDVASLGLPVHVSEFDCSMQVGHLDFRSDAEKRLAQVRLYHEAIEAYMALPARQQYGFTLWGVTATRDSSAALAEL